MLNELVVVEFASVLAGPAVGMFFAELGASVIKVENPDTGGDVTRSWRLAGEDQARISAYFSAVNWGKKSIAIDLNAKESRPLIRKLVQRADIVLISFKPGDDLKLGLDYETLSGINPRLIYAQVTGYGQNDPRTAYDAILQGACGFMYINGEPGSKPLKMPVALIDLLAAHQLKEAILLALLNREKHQKGAFLHTSLLASGISSLANQATNWLVAKKIPQPMGSAHPNISPYGSIFESSDGQHLILGVGNDKQFGHLCDILEQPELAKDPRFSCNAERVVHRSALESLLAEAIRLRRADSLMEALNKAKIPSGPILDMKAVFEQSAAAALLLRGEATGSPLGLKSIAFEADFLEDIQLTPPPELDQDHRLVKNFLGFAP